MSNHGLHQETQLYLRHGKSVLQLKSSKAFAGDQQQFGNKALLICRSKSCGETLWDASVVSLSHPIRLLGLLASKVQAWQQGKLYSFRLEEDLQGLPSSSSQKV